MNDRDRLNRIQADLQRAATVIYVEGKADPDIFFPLLGLVRPTADIHQNVYVAGLGGASGSAEVTALARVAGDNGEAGELGGGGIFGMIDGDGRDLPELTAEFDPPFPGPVFSWKTYCIENLLAKAAWPSAWGTPPNWSAVLEEYTPYAALNRVHRSLHLASKPRRGQATSTSVKNDDCNPFENRKGLASLPKR